MREQSNWIEEEWFLFPDHSSVCSFYSSTPFARQIEMIYRPSRHLNADSILIDIFSIAVFVRQVVVWFTNTSRNAQMSRNVVNARRSWRVSGQPDQVSAPASRSVKRPLPVPTAVSCATSASVNVSFAPFWSKSKRSLRYSAKHQNLPLRTKLVLITYVMDLRE